MSYRMQPINPDSSGQTKVTYYSPITCTWGVEANEMGIISFSGRVVDVGAGISGANPLDVKVYTTFNDGATWEEIVPETAVVMDGPGYFTWKRSQSNSSLVGPRVKAVIAPRSNGGDSWANITEMKRSDLDPDDTVHTPVSLSAATIETSIGFEYNGVSTGVILDTVTPLNSRPIPAQHVSGIDGKPQTMINGIAAFSQSMPNGADYMGVSNPDAVTSVFEYRVGGVGGTVVKTVTIVFTDAEHTDITSISEV